MSDLRKLLHTIGDTAVKLGPLADKEYLPFLCLLARVHRPGTLTEGDKMMRIMVGLIVELLSRLKLFVPLVTVTSNSLEAAEELVESMPSGITKKGELVGAEVNKFYIDLWRASSSDNEPLRAAMLMVMHAMSL